MTLPIERLLPRLFLVQLLAMLALAAWQWHRGAPLSSDLMTLVPGATQDPLVQRAEQRMQAPLNREMLVLVGHADRQQALALAEGLATRWQASGLFEKVQWNLHTDLQAVRTQLLRGRLAMLSATDRQQLAEQPDAFIEQRVQSLVDPFAGLSLVSSQDDWLGLSGRIQASQPRPANVQLDTASGALVAEADGKHWVLLRARTVGNAFDLNLPLQVEALLAQARRQADQAGAQLLAASGLLHAAAGQRQASREITWVGGGATVGILLLLLLALRRWRALLAFLPVAVGMLFGSVACVALFGQMHVMTLVLGASLIGVAVDYPLHYLSKGWSLRPWHSWTALRLTLPGMTLSLATSCIGYLALAFTPFPALTQIAAFSAAGLLGAYLCAVCLLPALLQHMDLRPSPWPLRVAQALTDLRERLLRKVPSVMLLGLLLVFCVAGLWQLQSRNDIRQWISAPPQLLEQAQAVARITGYQPTSQFFLVRADDQSQLLDRLQTLSGKLDELVDLGKLKGYLSLSQLVSSTAAQQQVRHALLQLPGHWQPLLALGVPEQVLHAELAQLQALAPLSIDDALQGPLGEAWRPLWLGQDGQGVAAIVSLQGHGDVSLLRLQAQDLPGVKLIDRLGELNQLFTATQVSAAELKLLSCALIGMVLMLPFGLRSALRIVALPLLAALCSLASLGWLGQPLTLFSLFGLLLVTAIGVDYAILMHERIGGSAVSLLGTLLAALTTWLSFGLLALSSTPAVSNFGLAVSLGLVFSFLLAPWAGANDRGHRQP